MGMNERELQRRRPSAFCLGVQKACSPATGVLHWRSSSMKKLSSGLLVGGNWVVDLVKTIDVYPEPEHLASILGQARGTGGAPYNILVTLAHCDAPFPLIGAGLLGRDDRGREILAHCRKLGIDTRFVGMTDRAPTSFTDVMTERGTGRRTFFHERGANALWRGEDLDFTRAPARWFHFAYFLLLDAMDRPDARYGTRAARLLAQAQAAGLKTSVDAVSVQSNRLAAVAGPALKYADLCFMNDFEAGALTGTVLRAKNGRLKTAEVVRAAEWLLDKGVREAVIVHFPEGSLARTRSGATLWQSSLQLPAGYVAGTTGAGDAFCAGVLMGRILDWEWPRCLQTGTCLAAACLSDPTATGGIGSLNQVLGLARRYGYGPVLA
jgi:sugar/nucleoside kinase (ribokinase family)